MIESQILALTPTGVPRLIKASDTEKFYAIASGESGSAAKSFPSDVVEDLNALTESEKMGIYASLNLQTKSVGLYDDFGLTGKYPNGSIITGFSSTPEIGNAWRIGTGTAGVQGKVLSGAFQCTGSELIYLGTTVETSGGRFSLGFEWEMATTQYFPSGANNLGLNISFNSGSGMITTGSGISPNGVLHINFDQAGVKQIDFFGTTGTVVCLNRNTGSQYTWHPSGYGIAPNKKNTLLFDVSGDILNITMVGLGTLMFSGDGISNRVGPTTNFWWEPGGPSGSLGTYNYKANLHRVWAQADSLSDRATCWGNLYDLTSNGPHKLPGQLQLYNGNGNKMMADSLPTQDIRIIAGATGTSVVGSTYTRALGGHFYAEGGYLSNVGGPNVGGSLIGRAPACISNTNQEFITSTILSTTGASATVSGTILRNLAYVIMLEDGDQEEWTIYGQLSGAFDKRIYIDSSTYGNVFFDSNAVGTPLNGLSGPYEISIFKHKNPTYAQLTYIKMTLPNGSGLPIQRFQGAQAYNYSYFQFKVASTGVAGQVSIDSIKHTVYRNKIN